MHFFPWILQHSRALDFAFYCLKGWAKLHNVNYVMFNQIDVFLVILHWYCVFALRFEYLDGVGLFAMGSASLKPQNLQTMTLITQHKPIERSTDMVSWQKKSNSSLAARFYMENLYGQRVTSKHVHARRRPGVPAPVMIKRKPILHHPWRNEQFGAVVSVNQNQT